jgi:hypothetical protein
MPQNTQPATPRRSYTDVVCSRMNGSRQYGNGAGGGLRGNWSGGFRGQSQGESFAHPGYQRPYQRYGNTSPYGGQGGGRRYDTRGWGFNGNFRQSEFRAGYGEQQQHPAQSRELGINMQGHGNVHGGASHYNPEVQTHGQGESQGNMGQQSAGTVGGGGSQSSAKVAEDTSSILASMMHLFQQFLESMGKKEVAHTTLPQGEIKEKKEQAKGEGEVPTKEIIESSA